MTILLPFLLCLTALLPQTTAQCFPDSLTYSPLLSPGPSPVHFTSCPNRADSPRVSPINATTFDWWYFDAVSLDGTQGLTIIFFTSSFLGFSFDVLNALAPLNVYVFANFGPGTVPVSFPVAASKVTVQMDGDGARGEWTGSGMEFEGSADLSVYTVTLDNPLLGLKGRFELRSRGPGHYVCSPLEGGVDAQITPHIGWVNVMPAADASVDVTVLGKSLKFTGHGYHDKNWGDKPFTAAIQSWYWGHGSFGGYNIVFFDIIGADGVNRVGGYALRDGKVVGSTCTAGGLKVRPVGTPYPPTLFSANPDALTINMTMSDGSFLDAVVQKKAVQIDVGLYTRWIGDIEGTFGGVTSRGTAVWEQFKT